MSEERTLYECCYILDVNMPEEQVAEIIALSEGVVTDAGSEVVGTRDFGSRRLAYEIDKHVAGSYRLLYFHGDNAAIDALQHELAVHPGVIRARVYVANPEAILRDSEADAAEAAAAEEAAAEEAVEAPVEEAAAEEAVEAPVEEPVVEEAVDAPAEEPAAEEAVEAPAEEPAAETEATESSEE